MSRAKITKTHRWPPELIGRVESLARLEDRPVQHVLDECIEAGLEAKEVTKMTRFTTWGSVRGDCGHLHLTVEAAEKCLQDDQRDCRLQGGYSDRGIRVLTGTLQEIRNELANYDVTQGPGEREED